MWPPLLPALGLLAARALALTVTTTTTTTLGIDPEGSARLNGESFQQSAVTTHNTYQYAAFYNSSGTYAQNHVALGRRALPAGAWQVIVFKDYVQTTIDGHNTISVGIAPADGTIHLSYDHHDVPLNYRVSQAGVATNPGSVVWSTALFGSTLHALPGAAAAGPWTPLTYPRFERIGADLLFEFRIGASGAGDSWLYRYTAGAWSSTGTKYLSGSNNNAYINGLDYLSERLHTSWTWRETPDVATNHDLGYAYSDDLGQTWRTSAGAAVSGAITPTTAGSLVFAIPQGSGILNQEAQTADAAGRFHVLNRETTSGTYLWYHYWRSATGAWTRTAISISGLDTPTATGLRGKLAPHSSGALIAILPSNVDTEVGLYVSTPEGGFGDWTKVWGGSGWAADPLWDKQRLAETGVLSLFLRQSGSYPARRVQVVDFGFA
ncbi:hypothetical protein EDC01DRAFT_666030 [Geopyxis carbonaria]|nr:hypothetical protein EDC01DRAFT_666030 [Geopyxis carbonaria]